MSTPPMSRCTKIRGFHRVFNKAWLGKCLCFTAGSFFHLQWVRWGCDVLSRNNGMYAWGPFNHLLFHILFYKAAFVTYTRTMLWYTIFRTCERCTLAWIECVPTNDNPTFFCSLCNLKLFDGRLVVNGWKTIRFGCN